MSLSLREQLIQAGLVSKKQVKQAQEHTRHQERQQVKHHPPRHKPEVVSEEKLAAQRAQAVKIARDLELNRKQREKAEKKARRAQIKQLVEQERVPAIESEEYYHFMDGKRVRRMAVDAQRREELIRGHLVIVRYHGFYAVVPLATAKRIRELDEQAVVSSDGGQTTMDQDGPGADASDPYKDFVVPDDLMW
jgi:uncharacterized protein YaiL (DUF2058 family)